MGAAANAAPIRQIAEYFDRACTLTKFQYELTDGGQFSFTSGWSGKSAMAPSFNPDEKMDGLNLDAIGAVKWSQPMTFRYGKPEISCDLTFEHTLSEEEFSLLRGLVTKNGADHYDQQLDTSEADQQFGTFRAHENANVTLSGSADKGQLILRATATLAN